MRACRALPAAPQETTPCTDARPPSFFQGDIIQTAAPYPQKYVKLEKGQVWVEGDNEKESKDSRMYGPVSRPSLSTPPFHPKLADV